MGLFDWLNAPTAEILYIEDGNRHELTASQYGEKCVEWGVGMGSVKMMELKAFGSERKSIDLLAKISHEPSVATTHSAAFFVAVYCSYPVIRLGVSNEQFKGIMEGCRLKILGGGILFADHSSSQEYLSYFSGIVGQYSATIFEVAGIASQKEQDQMLTGIGGACQKLLSTLEEKYSNIHVEQSNKSLDPSQMTFNPIIRKSMDIDADTLIISTLSNVAVQFVKSTDESGNISLL